MKSRLLKIAKHQKTQLNIAAMLAFNLRRGAVEHHNRKKILREIKRWQQGGWDSEQEIICIVMEQPCDIEDPTDLDKIGAAERLTLFRMGRLAYAGRVLP